MTGAGSADGQGMSVMELILENLLDLRQRVPFKAALVTFKPTGGATEVPFYNHRYTDGAVRHAIEEFIPSSPAFRLAASRPDEVLDWEKVPWFRTSVTATQWMIPAGYCQGTAMVLGEGLDGAVGSFHISITGEGFTADEVEALLSTRAFLTELARWDIVRRHSGLSPREMQILEYMALGWTNGEIAEKLVVARRTVATHIEHILRKLKADNRVQAAVIARQVGSGR
jgi:DNA-binding CsgD family transcriptional regulator